MAVLMCLYSKINPLVTELNTFSELQKTGILMGSIQQL